MSTAAAPCGHTNGEVSTQVRRHVVAQVPSPVILAAPGVEEQVGGPAECEHEDDVQKADDSILTQRISAGAGRLARGDEDLAGSR